MLKNNRVTDVFIFDGQENNSVNDTKSKSNIHHVKSVIYKDDSILRIKEKIVKSDWFPVKTDKKEEVDDE